MEKYLIDNEEVSFNEFYEKLEEQVSWECEDNYDYFIDDCYEEIEVMGMTFSPSYALKQLDEVAYRCGFNDYTDSRLSDVKYDLENYEEVNVNGYDFQIEEVEEEEEEEV